MKLIISQKVKGNYKGIFEKFDRNLFEYLTPKFPKMEIVEFGGSKPGNIVHIKFLSPVKQDWISEITEEQVNEKEAYFIDEGRKLPFPLKEWKHKHIIRKIDDNSSEIIDEMQFSSGIKLFDPFIYPGLFLAFNPRKKLYENYFGKI